MITNCSIGITKVDEHFINSSVSSGVIVVFVIVVFVVARTASDETTDLCKTARTATNQPSCHRAGILVDTLNKHKMTRNFACISQPKRKRWVKIGPGATSSVECISRWMHLRRPDHNVGFSYRAIIYQLECASSSSWDFCSHLIEFH